MSRSHELSRRSHPIRLTALLCGLFLASASVASAQPTFTKVFSPDTIGPGSVSTLTFTIDNSISAAPVTGLAFTDVLPAGVTLADPAIPQSTCNGTLSAPAGGSTITLTDGDLGGSSTCTIQVNVTGSTAGTYMNLSGDLTSSAGNSGPASANLTVATNRPGFTKSFAPSSVPIGSRTRLTFTIDNSADANQALQMRFSDTLPPGLVVADPANTSNTCIVSPFTGGTVTAAPGGDTVALALGGGIDFGAVAAGGTCTVGVDVVPSGLGDLDNLSGELLSTTPSTVSSGYATATLTTTANQVLLTKEFTDDPVVPGGTVDLQFTIFNRSRTDAVTDIAFSDDLNATLSGLVATGLPMNGVCGAGSVLSGTSTITLTGGNLAAQASCTFIATLQVPAAAVPGAYPNTTTAVTWGSGGSSTGNQASDTLFVSTAPALTKTFLDNPVVAGGSTELQFTITNTSTTSSATDISFQDVFESILPTASATPGTGFCGPSSTSTFTPLINTTGSATPAQLSVSGASLAPGASCTFSITLDVSADAAAGLYPNTTSEVTGTVDATSVTGAAASDDLEVVAGPRLVKQFTDDPVTPGDTVTLQFTLTHDQNATTDATGISFTDDLDATLTGLVAIGLPLNDVCGTGSQISGTSTLSLTGGTLAPGESCQFSVTLQVPAGATANVYTNTTSDVTSTVSGLAVTGPPASDDLTVAGLTLTKEFTDDPVIPGGTVHLQFTLVNQAGAPAASNINFRDNLSDIVSGLTFDSGSVPATPCGAGSTIALSLGDAQMFLSGGSLGPGEMCQFTMTVNVGAGVPSATYGNTTQLFDATIDGNVIFLQNAYDVLTVAGDVLELSKTFLTNPATPGALVDLQFQIANLSLSGAATGIGFTDDLNAALAGLQAVSLPADGFCGAGSQVTGTSMLTVTGAQLAAGGSCTFTVTVQVPAMTSAAQAVNTTSQVTGSIGGLAVTGAAASDTLAIQNASFSKSFDGPAVAGGTAVLTFTIEDLAGGGLSDLGFTDDLDAALSGLVATGLPMSNVCGSGSSLSGTSVLTLTGGSVAGGNSCSFNVTVQVPGGATAGSYTNTTSSLFTSGLAVASPATADLDIEPPPTFAKVFAPDVISSTGISTLTFTIDNSASALAATTLAFTDNLPTDLTVATPSNASTTCGGTVTATAGSGAISLANGSVGAGMSCTVSADVTATVAGVYDNTSGDLTSSSGNSGTAADSLTVEPPPTFAKAFAPGVISVAGVSTLTFTVDNSANTLAVTGLDFTDNLPAGVTVASPSNAATTCGGTVTAVAASGVISFTGGSVAGGATCTVSADVTSSVPGSHVNLTGSLTSSAGDSGTATDTLTVEAPPTFAKAFAPDVISVAGISTLTFTIDNSASSLAATGLDFTDNLPAGVTVANPSNAATTCGGSVTAVAASGAVSFTGGSVGAGATCTVSADVTSSVPGGHVNTSGNLTSSGGDSGTATDTLTVEPPPAFTKAFAPDGIASGDTSTLTFTIDNSASSLGVTGLDLTDNLPADVTVANPSNAATTCGGTVTAVAASGAVSFTGGAVGAGATCTVSADVTSSVPGDHVNVSGNLTSSGGDSGTATATLSVEPPPSLAKAFAPDSVALGETTVLTFTIDNSASSLAATGLGFTDNLPSGMRVADPANAVSDCGGTVDANPLATSISFSGGTVAAGTICTVSVDVTSLSSGANVNVTEQLSSSLGSSAPATGTLTVAANALEIPTLGQWGLLLLALGIGLVALRKISLG